MASISESAAATAARARALCPKQMRHGPCGAVDAQGLCEIGSMRCPFVDAPVAQWDGIASAAARVGEDAPVLRVPSGTVLQRVPSADATVVPEPADRLLPAAEAFAQQLAMGRMVIAEFPGRACDAGNYRACADVMRGRVDAVLSGDASTSRVQFGPGLRAQLLHDCGLPAVVSVNCRDRNRVAIEGEIAGLATAHAAMVHAVTGDLTGSGGRPDAQPVFDIDSTEVAAIARHWGHLVSVAESPLAPPARLRAARLQQKVAAGASVCFVNHSGGVDAVRRFIGECHGLGLECDFIPCVPVIIGPASASLLRSFPTMALPDGYEDAVLGAPAPEAAGIEAAIALSLEMLQLDGVVGVDLSGGAGFGMELAYAEAVSLIGEGIRERV